MFWICKHAVAIYACAGHEYLTGADPMLEMYLKVLELRRDDPFVHVTSFLQVYCGEL